MPPFISMPEPVMASTNVSSAVAGMQAIVTPDTPSFARVLLVDDNEADILLTRRLLFDRRGLRCEFEFARSVAEAFQRMKSAHEAGRAFHLVLLDVNMPGHDGFELLRQMRADRALRATLVVMCSGSGHPKDISQALFHGAIGYMTKPPTLGKLRNILERLPTLDLRDEGEDHSLLHIA